MERRGVSDNSPVKGFIGGVYKEIGRFLGTRGESRIVVYGKEVVT